MEAREIILKPVITEASTDILSDNKYTFDVDKRANKTQVKQAVEEIFDGVKVKKVNILNQKGKKKRQGRYVGKTPRRRKAIVTLSEDSKDIALFGDKKDEKKK